MNDSPIGKFISGPQAISEFNRSLEHPEARIAGVGYINKKNMSKPKRTKPSEFFRQFLDWSPNGEDKQYMAAVDDKNGFSVYTRGKKTAWKITLTVSEVDPEEIPESTDKV